MTAFALPSDGAFKPLVATAAKETSVEALIGDYANKHMAMDIGIGLAGFIPIPGAGIAATMAAVAAQAPIIYQPMASEISEIYMRDTDAVTRGEVIRGAISGGVQDVAVYFGVEFLKELAGEIAQELGVGLGLAAIPILGGAIGIGLDMKIAHKMTWRVGFMVALYQENGGQWVKDRRHSYDLATNFLKANSGSGIKPRIKDFVNKVEEVKSNQESVIITMAQFLISSGISKDDVARKLRDRGVDPGLIERALSRF